MRESFHTLKKLAKERLPQAPVLKVALLGDSATQFLGLALKGAAVREGFCLDLWEADFNQVERQVLDPGSELHRFGADYVILFQSAHKLLNTYSRYEPQERIHLAQNRIDLLHQLIAQILPPTRIICFNYAEIDDQVWGNYAAKREDSFQEQVRRLNLALSELSRANDRFWVYDLNALQSKWGRNVLFQPSVYVNSEMVLSLDAIPMVGMSLAQMMATQKGRFKKCLILDLDNTLWGGVIGDDGIENIQIGGLGIGKAFTEFQYWIKKLKQRGIILAVCSKNTESVAKEPFEKHPDMVLHLSDMAVFVANWDNKADNIRRIQGMLNIAFDSMVFLDDNPVERQIVRQELPQICVPELPEDPAAYLEYLYELNLFETASYDKADEARTEQYRKEALRVQQQQSFTNEKDFLASLNMRSKVESITDFNKPRIAQLSQRSNQFNLRTLRYAESDLDVLRQDPAVRVFSFTLEDKFGDNGLVAVIVLREEGDAAFIENWFMSCRVLKRGMEQFCLNLLATEARKWGKSRLIGEYLPTPKNALVEKHYEDLGFKALPGQSSQRMSLDLSDYRPAEVFIESEPRTV